VCKSVVGLIVLSRGLSGSMHVPPFVNVGVYAGLICGFIGLVLLLVFRRSALQKLRFSYWILTLLFAYISAISITTLLHIYFAIERIAGVPIAYIHGVLSWTFLATVIILAILCIVSRRKSSVSKV